VPEQGGLREFFVRSTDEHPIFDQGTRELMNPKRGVVIGDKVWLGRTVTVNKGANIPSVCFIGTCSIVSVPLPTANAICAVTPARMLRENILWAKNPRNVPLA
jgi:acetyltransferase-like isoleucine patch superfamily enzyme